MELLSDSMPKIKRSSSEPSSLCYIGLSYQEELNKSPNTPSHHGIPTGNTTGAEAAFHISGKTILSWGYAAMECVIESVMELMVDTHCTLWCVCVGNYFHHCYNYYYYIFWDYDGFAFYCETSHVSSGTIG